MSSRTITISLEDSLVTYLRSSPDGISGTVAKALVSYRNGQRPTPTPKPAYLPPPVFTMPPIPIPAVSPKLAALYPPIPGTVSVDTTARDEARDRYDDTGPYDQPFEEWYALQRSLGVLP